MFLFFTYEIGQFSKRSVQKGVHRKKCSVKEVLKKEFM